ncbi:MAG: glycosyltransferase [Planctomycetota bacterium]|nr:glycosyltransferase [Planctomycetota bacterium]
MTTDEYASHHRGGAGDDPGLFVDGAPLDRLRQGPVRRVLFFGKSMSRTRCTGALVDALRRHGVDVRWRNLVTWRRWFGIQAAHRLCRAEFRRYKPDVVFVFFRDLPLALASEFRRTARIVVWCEEALETMDASVIEYFRQADIVCMSNPARFAWLREHGLSNMAFLMSGFAPRYHRPLARQAQVRDVAFIGGPGRRGQRASLLAKIAEEFDTEVYGRHWDRWVGSYRHLRVRGQVNNKAYARICATSRIVLGVNEVNEDAYYCSNRTFLTMACGAFHLTHYVPRLEEVFVDGQHLAYYRDEEDALEKIRQWLPLAEERAQVAASGHAEVMQHHQYYHRVARILHWLESGLPREDQQLLPTQALSSTPPVQQPRS